MKPLELLVNSRLFAIGLQPDEGDTAQVDTWTKGILEEAKKRLAKAKKDIYKIHDDGIIQELSPWLRRTGWMSEFNGKDMKVLNDLLEKPKPEDSAKIHLVWDSVARVIEQCWKGVKDCSDRKWRQLLYWLSSASKAESSSTPFSIYMAKKTREGYAKYLQQFMMFALHGLDDPEGEYGIEYTEEQAAALEGIKTELVNEDVSEENLDKKVLAALILFIQHSDFEKERSALLYYTGVVGFHMGWKRWRNPAGYTSILAGLQWGIRLLILESAVPMEERDNWDELHENDPLEEFSAVHAEYFLVDVTMLMTGTWWLENHIHMQQSMI